MRFIIACINVGHICAQWLSSLLFMDVCVSSVCHSDLLAEDEVLADSHLSLRMKSFNLKDFLSLVLSCGTH